MYRHDRRSRLLAGLLAAMAGMIDGIGFLGSGGFFVSFMSGNSTRLGVGLADRLEAALIACMLIGSFVLGVMLSTLAKRRIPGFGRPSAILTAVAAVLTGSALLAEWAPGLIVFAMLALTMGAMNLVFEEDGEIRIGLTYMTGTLVKLGSSLADALLGAGHRRWPPLLMQWLALVIGAGIGGQLFAWLGVQALWMAALAAWVAVLLARGVGASGR